MAALTLEVSKASSGETLSNQEVPLPMAFKLPSAPGLIPIPKPPGASRTQVARSKPYLGKALAPAPVELPQLPLHLPQRLPPLRLRLGSDQVPESLCRRQVQLAPTECSASELPGLGGTEPGQAPCQCRGEPPSPTLGAPTDTPAASRL